MGRLRRVVQGPLTGRYSATGGIESIPRQAGGRHGFRSTGRFWDSRLDRSFLLGWFNIGLTQGGTVEARGSQQTPIFNPRVTIFITAPWAYYSARSSTLERNTEEAHSSQRIQVFRSSRSHYYSSGLSHGAHRSQGPVSTRRGKRFLSSGPQAMDRN